MWHAGCSCPDWSSFSRLVHMCCLHAPISLTGLQLHKNYYTTRTCVIIIIIIIIIIVLQLFIGPWPLFDFLEPILGRTPWTGDQPVARVVSLLPTHRTAKTQNKHTQTSMPRVGFEPTIPAFERAKTVHALDRAYMRYY
jgi:hypothetical protein